MAKKDVFTLGVMRDNSDDGVETPMNYAVLYYSPEEAEKNALELLKELKTWEDGPYTVFIMSGEWEDEKGNVFGEPNSTWEMSTNDIQGANANTIVLTTEAKRMSERAEKFAGYNYDNIKKYASEWIEEANDLKIKVDGFIRMLYEAKDK